MTVPDPAAELREAAGHMRREDPAQFGPEFWAALADLIELEATITESIGRLRLLIPPEPGERPALAPLNKAIRAVAKTYLGTDAR